MPTLHEVFSLLLPSVWLDSFDVESIKEQAHEYQITLVEKSTMIPKELKGKMVVQNGYMSPIEILDYPLRGKSTYLTFLRRRWKEPGSTESYANTYTFHEEGMKATKEFGAFLKACDRKEADQL